MEKNDVDASLQPGDGNFTPIVATGLYTGIERGLAADLVAARSLGGIAMPVCTAFIIASRGHVTDVLEVPADTIDAQLEHTFTNGAPNAVKLGVMISAITVKTVFSRLKKHLAKTPVLLDLTLSGPSGEELASSAGIEALTHHLAVPDLVSIRKEDVRAMIGMDLQSLDDAQVVAQRLALLGARNVLIRCGQVNARHFSSQVSEPEYVVDLFFDGEEFALFEAPRIPDDAAHGASSAFTMSILSGMAAGRPILEAIRDAKAYVTEALRLAMHGENHMLLRYF